MGSLGARNTVGSTAPEMEGGSGKFPWLLDIYISPSRLTYLTIGASARGGPRLKGFQLILLAGRLVEPEFKPEF